MIKQFLMLLVGMAACSVPLPAQDWKSKITPEVLEQASAGEVEFLAILHPQADLSAAGRLRSKEEKGQYVYEQLTRIATESQAGAVRTIKGYGAQHIPFFIVNTIWVKGDIRLIEALARLPEIKEIVPNPRVRLQEPTAEETSLQFRAIEWGITKIKADQVWALGKTGQGVVIGGQDTGYDWSHPALIGKYRGWNGSVADHNYNWHDAVHSIDVHNSGPNPCGLNSPVPCDDHNHGTHTMGTMAGDDGAGNQIGVAPGARWIGCRNMERGWGTPATYLECFQWFLAPTDQNNANPKPALAPHVINNSWACPTEEGCTPGNFYILQQAANNLVSAGIVVVVSAGNSGSSCATIDSPAAIFDSTYTVGATNSSDVIASFSSRGPVIVDGSNRLKPDISAPGVSVRSCIIGTGYASFSGTSMAGPHVAGAVALVISANPNLAGQVSQIESMLNSTAVPLYTTQNCGGDTPSALPNHTYGHGRINALAAVQAALTLLPVELTAFKGIWKGDYAALEWTTASEHHSDYFLVERLSEGENAFQVAGRVAAAGSSNSVRHYQFNDFHASPGVNYYRLCQVDWDGAAHFWPVITVQAPKSLHTEIFPNPSFGVVSLRLGGELEFPVGLHLFNSIGQHAKTFVITEFQTLLHLPAGVWFGQLQAGRQIWRIPRFVVQ